MILKLKIPAICLLIIMFSGCGYRFTGGGNFPSDVKSIFVTNFKNRTSESGLETIITNELIDEFTKNRKDALASRQDEAEAVLTGVVKSIDISTISHDEINISNERRVTIRVDLKLVHKGRSIWNASSISADEAYSVVAGDKVRTEQNKNRAIALAADRLSEKIFNRLTEDF